MGVGMVLVIGSRTVQRALRLFENLGQKAWIIGEVIKGDGINILDK
jgi:phosphoribosylformylglycinamidine cyclo-ligase